VKRWNLSFYAKNRQTRYCYHYTPGDSFFDIKTRVHFCIRAFFKDDLEEHWLRVSVNSKNSRRCVFFNLEEGCTTIEEKSESSSAYQP